MLSYNEQLRMFKDMVPIGIKETSELVELLEEKVDIREISLDSLPGNLKQVTLFNACHCILNSNLQLDTDKMLFKAFQVILNEKSSSYIDRELQEKFIYVIFEKNTGYISSNCNRLFIELELARGISQSEFDSEGIQLRSLISRLAIDYCEKNNLN